jgi:ketosteroid isomerase-like protein
VATANLDLVRSLYATWERGDFTSTDWAHPDIEFVIADGPAAGSWTGLAGMADGWKELTSAWANHSTEAQEYRELDDGRVLVISRWLGRAKLSGLDLAQMQAKSAAIYQFDEGKVTRLVIYGDHNQALADLGLTSEISSDS